MYQESLTGSDLHRQNAKTRVSSLISHLNNKKHTHKLKLHRTKINPAYCIHTICRNTLIIHDPSPNTDTNLHRQNAKTRVRYCMAPFNHFIFLTTPGILTSPLSDNHRSPCTRDLLKSISLFILALFIMQQVLSLTPFHPTRTHR